MQGPRCRTWRQRGGRAWGRRGNRAPDRHQGAHLDPRAAKRQGQRSSGIRNYCSTTTRRAPAAQTPATRGAGLLYTTSERRRRRRRRRGLRKSHVTAVQPPAPPLAETWLAHWFSSQRGGTQTQRGDALFGRKSVRLWTNGLGAEGPEDGLNCVCQTGVKPGRRFLSPSLIGFFTAIGRGLLGSRKAHCSRSLSVVSKGKQGRGLIRCCVRPRAPVSRAGGKRVT